jgi:hypothetical protein
MHSVESLLRSRHSVGRESEKVKEQQSAVKAAERKWKRRVHKSRMHLKASKRGTVGGESDKEKEQGVSAEKPNAFESEKVKEQQSEVKATMRKSSERDRQMHSVKTSLRSRH